MRNRLFALAESRGVALGATGTHPWADYREQRNIDTEHYRRVVDGLRYVARRNNTFSLHVHVGARDVERAVRACDRLRPVLPLLLSISANSPYLDARDSGLHSARSQVFTKSFPRCGIPDAFGSWKAFRDYIELLIRTDSISRVHPGVVVDPPAPRPSGPSRCASATRRPPRQEAEALSGLIVACVAQALRDIDEGVPFTDPPRRLIEENFWRAIRYGQDGTLLDLDRGEAFPAAAATERLLQWTAPVRAELGHRADASRRSTAPSASAGRSTAGASMQEVFAAAVRETSQTYVQEAETA